jgi:nucleoside-diphosphate-sugar epimerase
LAQAAGVSWVAGDLDDDAALGDLIAGAEAVVHCAGAVRGASAAAFDRINVDATRRLAAAAARQRPAPRFLLISSLAAREPNLSHYAASKRAGERALEQAGDALSWTIVRPPAVYGPGDRELLPLFRSMARGYAPLPTNSGARLSLLHVDDLARAVVCWLRTDLSPRMCFELDDGRAAGYDWPALIGIARGVLRAGQPIRQLPIPLRALRFVARVNLMAATMFGYSPMLTPGKVRELAHRDWVCRNGDFSTLTGWQAQYGFERGLAELFPAGAPGALVR